MIKAIIFDLDGTLVDTDHANYEAYRLSCLKENVIINYDSYVKTSGLGWKESIPRFSGIIDPEAVKRIHDNKIIFYRDTLKLCKPITPMLEILKTLRYRYLTALVTSASKESAGDLLKYLNIDKLFNVIITSKDVATNKPHPEGLLKAANMLNVRPEECLVFEDSKFGFEAAEKAGMHYIDIGGYKDESGNISSRSGN